MLWELLRDRKGNGRGTHSEHEMPLTTACKFPAGISINANKIHALDLVRQKHMACMESPTVIYKVLFPPLPHLCKHVQALEEGAEGVF